MLVSCKGDGERGEWATHSKVFIQSDFPPFNPMEKVLLSQWTFGCELPEICEIWVLEWNVVTVFDQWEAGVGRKFQNVENRQEWAG